MVHTARLTLIAVATVLVLGAPAAAQEDDGNGIDIRSPGDDGVTILPRPNSGQAPENPGDPGGWQQLLLLGLIVVALVAIATLVIRQSRKERAAL